MTLSKKSLAFILCISCLFLLLGTACTKSKEVGHEMKKDSNEAGHEIKDGSKKAWQETKDVFK